VETEVLGKKTCPITNLSVIHLTWTGLGLNQELMRPCSGGSCYGACHSHETVFS
jgi:hypothetical protein